MTVADLRKLLNDTPTAFDGFQVLDDQTGRELNLAWSVRPTERNVGAIKDTYGPNLYLSDITD
jgi:hypothetical protein